MCRLATPRLANISLNTPSFPPPRFRLPTLDFSDDAQVSKSLTTSTNTIKPGQLLSWSESPLDYVGDSDVEG
ncbi:hypothetical protein TRAPUB_3618 [Trametes pubescens]|uniref:Uncharacterized protein n=1 Tax=Trametes pubescens TaxID=154538 RepID=A0A1M2VD87_TRAPU|nr:hypothetical protein TRAPUB_3618 [Trametes pubescens]